MTRNKMASGHSINCLVSLGMFSDERTILIDLLNHDMAVAFVDKRHVVAKAEPEPGKSVPGRVKVRLVAKKSNSAIVDLPQPTLTSGPRIEVPVGLLR